MKRLIVLTTIIVLIVGVLALWANAYMYSVSIGEPGYLPAMKAYLEAWFRSWSR